MSINNKTILILTAQFGAGHISAAQAIKDYTITILILKNLLTLDMIYHINYIHLNL